MVKDEKGNEMNQYIIPSSGGLGTRSVSKKEHTEYIKSIEKAAVFLLGDQPKKKLKKMPAVKETVVKQLKAPKAGSKQARVNELVKSVLTDNTRVLDKNFKQEIISEIVTLCEMTRAGATTYFYNAMKMI
jgi:hypothetical protein